jgi:hypothetical protein
MVKTETQGMGTEILKANIWLGQEIKAVIIAVACSTHGGALNHVKCLGLQL